MYSTTFYNIKICWSMYIAAIWNTKFYWSMYITAICNTKFHWSMSSSFLVIFMTLIMLKLILVYSAISF